MIEIVCSIDEHYIEYCGVMLTSLFVNTPHTDFRIHIICSSKVSDSQKSRLQDFCGKNKAAVLFYDVPYAFIQDFPIKEKDHLSLAAYLRLFMSELIPDNIDKVIYLDCDLITLQPIKELWEMDIENIAVAAVEERPPFDTKSPARLQYPEKYSYFNSGVMVINLKRWREKNLPQLCKQYIKDHYDQIELHDQDVLNALLYNEKQHISIRWNLMDFFLYSEPEVQPHRVQDWQNALRSPAIVHFTGKRKPWLHNCDSPFRDQYIDLAKQYGWKVITTQNAIWYSLRKVLYRIIKKKKTIDIQSYK